MNHTSSATNNVFYRAVLHYSKVSAAMHLKSSIQARCDARALNFLIEKTLHTIHTVQPLP
jgi:hypothetical protein